LKRFSNHGCGVFVRKRQGGRASVVFGVESAESLGQLGQVRWARASLARREHRPASGLRNLAKKDETTACLLPRRRAYPRIIVVALGKTNHLVGERHDGSIITSPPRGVCSARPVADWIVVEKHGRSTVGASGRCFANLGKEGRL
jgi:hypothetical protein